MFKDDFENLDILSPRYGYDLDVSDLFNAWEHHKYDNVLTYRDHGHVSKFTGKKAPPAPVTFMEAHDDSLEAFVQA